METIKVIYRWLRKCWFTLLKGYPARLKGESFKVDTQYIGFWKNATRGDWEPESFVLLEQHLNPDDLYLDIGAYIGPTALFASRKCAKVICFEPDPVAFKVLSNNIDRNKATNIHPYNCAISHYDGVSRMSSFASTKGLGETMTSLVSDHEGKETFEALVLSWQTIERCFDLTSLKMIKIDVEGAEFDLIPGMLDYLKKYTPVLWLSIHPTFIDPSTSEKRVRQLVKQLSFYNICINDQLQETHISEMFSNESLAGYPSFLLKN